MTSVPMTFTFKRRRKARLPAHAEPATPSGNIPRASRLMALALHFESIRRRGLVTDYADMARLGDVTRARMTLDLALCQPLLKQDGECHQAGLARDCRRQLHRLGLRPGFDFPRSPATGDKVDGALDGGSSPFTPRTWRCSTR